MVILFKKVIRSMMGNKKVYVSCIFLLFMGVALYISMQSSVFLLKSYSDQYYENNRLADVFISVAKISDDDIDKLYEIEGIKQVMPRIVVDSEVIINGENTKVRLISYNKSAYNMINEPIISGKLYNYDDIVIGETYMNVNKLNIGDSLDIYYNNKLTKMNISGTFISPEYVYMLEDAQSILPNEKGFTVSYVDEEVLQNITDMPLQYNDIVILLEEGYSYNDVKNELKSTLDKYGLKSIHDRDGLVSYTYLEEEIKSSKAMSTAMPVMFLMMTLVILYLVLKRSVEQDRKVLGTLKAFGFTNSEILIHYLMYGVIVGLISTVIAWSISAKMTDSLLQTYLTMYRLPIGHSTKSSFLYYIYGGVFAVFSATIGAFFGAKSVIKLSPSMAMRSEVPVVKSDNLKNSKIAKEILTPSGFMAIRNIKRNRVRSIFIVISIAFSFAIFVLMASYNGMIDSMLYTQFEKVEQYDLEAKLITPVDLELSLSEILDIKGVDFASVRNDIPVTLSRNDEVHGTMLIAMSENERLYKLYDDKYNKFFEMPSNGILLSSTIAKKLNVKEGDYVYIDTPYFNYAEPITVSKIINQSFGSSAYISIENLSKYTNNKYINTLMIKTKDKNYVKEKLSEAKNIANTQDLTSTMKGYKDTMSAYDSMLGMIVFVGIFVAFLIVYNTQVMAMSERTNEYATIRVMGMSIKEVSSILEFEYFILTIVGIIAGIPINIGIKMLLTKVMEGMSLSFPNYTSIKQYSVGVILTIVVVIISNLSTRRMIKKIVITDSLKERD